MKSKDLVYVSLCSVIIIICSWISIPTAVPFTMQTFAIFLTVLVLGGKLGTVSVLLYLCLGAIGLPVFSGFKGGLAALTGPTGGYLFGFLFTALIMWFFEAHFGKKKSVFIISSLIGLFVCYAIGTFWFVRVFTATGGSMDTLTALSMCVIPFIVPDIAKIFIAFFIGNRVSDSINKSAKN